MAVADKIDTSTWTEIATTRTATASSKARRRLLGDRLIRQAAEGDARQRAAALQDLVVLYLPVAKAEAGRYRHRGCELEDLEQVACLALVSAVQRFDSRRGNDFLSFAVPTIRGNLRRHFRDRGWMVRPPRSLQELQPRVLDEMATSDPATGRPRTVEEIATRLGTNVASVREAAQVRGCFAPASLDAPMGPTGGDGMGVLLAGDGERDLEAAETRCVLVDALAGLTSEERALLRMRFWEGRTQEEIARSLEVGQSQVSRRLRRVLGELRAHLSDDQEHAGPVG